MIAHIKWNKERMSERIKGTIKYCNALESVLVVLLLGSNKCVIYYYRAFQTPTIPIHIQCSMFDVRCSHSFLNVNNFITVIVS